MISTRSASTIITIAEMKQNRVREIPGSETMQVQARERGLIMMQPCVPMQESLEQERSERSAKTRRKKVNTQRRAELCAST